MASSSNFGPQAFIKNLEPQARSAMSAYLGWMLTELNQTETGGGIAQASSSNGTRRATKSRGGTHEQHVQAGHLGGIAAPKRRTGRPRKSSQTQQAQS